MYRLLKEFWVNSYKTDSIAFWLELFSVTVTVCGSAVLTFTSPHPIMSIVFPLYWLGSSSMCYAGFRRRLVWIATLTGWFTVMNTIGLYKVFIQ